MKSKRRRDIVRSIKLTEEEDDQLVAMADYLGLPVQELLRCGGFKEGRRLLYLERRKNRPAPLRFRSRS